MMSDCARGKARTVFFSTMLALAAAAFPAQKARGLEIAEGAAAPEVPIVGLETVPALQEGGFPIGADLLAVPAGELPIETTLGPLPSAALPARILTAGPAQAKAADPAPVAAKAAAAARKSAFKPLPAASDKSRRDLSPMRALERVAQHKILLASAFDGSAAPQIAGGADFPISARAYYAASLSMARKIPLTPAHLADLRGRIGLDDAAILRFSGRERQHGKTCARHALAACAEANGRAAGQDGAALLLRVMSSAKLAKLSLLQESLAKYEQARRRRIEEGRDTSSLDEKIKAVNLRLILGEAFPENEGLNEREEQRTAELAGLNYRSLGHASGLRGIQDPALGPGIAEQFRLTSADLKTVLDKELAQKNAVMAGIYTGVRDGGGDGHHAVTILGKGRGQTGDSYYVLYDSNAGHALLYPEKNLHVYKAAVVK